MRRMDEGIVTSEKCWSGIEEEMSEISKELVETWRNFFKCNPKILTEEKSWRTQKSNQNIVMGEE